MELSYSKSREIHQTQTGAPSKATQKKYTLEKLFSLYDKPGFLHQILKDYMQEIKFKKNNDLLARGFPIKDNCFSKFKIIPDLLNNDKEG